MRNVELARDFSHLETVGEVKQDRSLTWSDSLKQEIEHVMRADRRQKGLIAIETIGRRAFRLGKVSDETSRMTAFQGIDAATSMQAIQQMQVAALDVPAQALSCASGFPLPQVNKGLLDQVFLRRSIGGKRLDQSPQYSVNLELINEHNSDSIPKAQTA